MKMKKLLFLLMVLALACLSQILTAQSALFDDSNGPFTILAQAVTVLSPNGGENWKGGETHNITWSSTETTTNVNIYYSTDSGSNWTLVATNIANSGTHAWTVLNTPSTTCLMRISDAANAATYDVSDTVFSISEAPTLTMLTPNGGENLMTGSSHNVIWSSTGTIANVNIDYSTNSGGSWTPVAVNIANSSTYNWTVPTTLSTNCLMRVSDVTNAGVSDVSDNVFTISAVPTLTVISPNGGENWISGSAQNITWTSTGMITNINIDYSTDSGGNWTLVVVNIANSGVFNWTVPNTSSTNCLVRISNTANANNNDSSDSFFTISASGTETISTPNQPIGPASGSSGSSYTYSSGAADSNLGHVVQYKFDWNDGTDSGWLAEGTTSASHIWAFSGIYQVQAMARCILHTSVESLWSEKHIVTISGNTPQLQWKTFMGNLASGNAIVTDSSGNIYVTGDSDVTWGSPLNPYAGGKETFVAKLNAKGVLLWHTFLGSHYYDAGRSIAVDNSGNIYVTGESNDTWGSPLRAFSGTPGYTYECFAAKLNTNGTLLWNTFLGGTANDGGDEIVIDNNGDILVAGTSKYTWGTPINPFTYGDYNGFLVRMSPNGAMVWLTFFAGGGCSEIKGIDQDVSGNIFLMGKSDVAWGSPLNPHSGSSDFFLVKFNGNGTREWNTFSGGGAFGSGGGDIAVDNNGNIYVIGGSNSTWGNPLNPYGGGTYDTFVSKFNASGVSQWHTFLGGSGVDFGEGVTLDGGDNIYVTGFSDASWGSPLSPFTGDGNPFVAKLNFNGTLQWNTFLGYGNGNAITMDNSENIIVGGSKSGIAFVAKIAFITNNLLVTAPNGGENWINGTAQNITWSSTGAIANIKIDYSTDNGSSWAPLASNIANSGTYTWIVPTLLSANCLVRVSDAANTNTYDTSNAVFTISAAPTLTVTAPNGGENLISGTAQNITWSSTGAIVNVNIDYSTDSGSNWAPVAATIANSGTFSWTVPATPSTNCMVRISDAANSAVFDVSNVKFTISVATSITVISPNGGEQWQRGTSQTITWTSGGVANIKIELLKGTTVNKTITTSTPAAAGSYTWAISSTQTAGTDYKIRITSTSSSTVTDSSNANFTIFIPSITISAPAAANAWIRGTSKNITWTVQGTVNANVKIQLFKGTTKTLDITTSTPTANGTFTWNIPSTLATATTYVVKVITLDNLVTGTSGTFSIVTGIITVMAPAAGTNWQRGVAHAITWTKEGTLNTNVKIQLYKGTALDSTIASTTANDGTYDWTIPASKTLATNYKIRITTADNLVTGNSGVFSITNTSGLTLQTPNGNERLAAKITVPINWTVDPSINEVKLEYSRDNGISWTSAAANVANSGSYAWKVPNTPSTTCLVRVSDAANAGTNDISNGVFAIIAGEKAAADFDNNGVSDMVWRYYGESDNKGRNIICLLNGDGTGKGKVSLPEMSDLNWKICGVGDFNNDGVLDILWRHYGLGINGIWSLNADNTIKNRQPLPALSDLNYQINSVGDFNDDGVLDIIWRHYRSGKNMIWLMNADHTILSLQALMEVTDINWKICAVGDFNNDGVFDILWRHYGTGSNIIWLMNADYTILSGQALPGMIDLNYKISGVGDFNGDGILDIIWRHYDSGRSGVWLMNGDYSLSAWRPLPDFPDVRMSDLSWQITNNNNNDTIVNSSASSTLAVADSLEIERMTETSKSNAGEAASSQLPTATLQIIFPNGSENWCAGTMHDISWNTNGPIPNVTIDYSLDNGNIWIPLAINTVNSGAYVWTVPTAISANCLLRISDSTNSKIVDASDGTFSISSSAMETVSTPRQPSGSDMGLTNTSYSFTSGSANSSFGDAMQYKFDWGDGSDSGWLETGTISAVHAWTSRGIYPVRVMARAKKTGVESPWSTAHDIVMADSPND